ncbi:MAG: NADH-quinone oxidoreductase subunit NuoN [Zoogloeaceae bacterium]|jgi:NADH-quinone oxidoreductase subunit N|nr:NADH-quinone oxidoreductase subunit NuoN [Zoogloeaceae bacterium]
MFDRFVIPSFAPAIPEIFLLVMACLILLLDLAVKSPRRSVTFALTQLTLLGCAVITLYQVKLSLADATMFYAERTFGGMFVRDPLADFLKLLTYLAVSLTLFYSRAYLNARAAIPKGEYFVLALFATLGMMVMISGNHFLVLYLGLEILSLSLYAMIAMNRDCPTATEAAMKYFVLGALASGLLLYGMSMLYGATGSLELTDITNLLPFRQHDRTLIVFGIVFLVAGLAFKLGLAPFHMWIPDVYHGAPTPAALFVAAAPKLAAFAVLMRLLVLGQTAFADDWQSMLILLAVLSMLVGNVIAIAQTNIKRMLAYSAISHMGFMLLGIVTGVVSPERFEGGDNFPVYSFAMFYAVSYVLTTLAAFGVILLLSRAGFESDTLEDFKGLNRRSPWLAALMLVLMFSMAGVPPFVGFFAKFFVWEAVMEAGYVWLALAALLFSLIGAFYYLRVVWYMYFEAPVETGPIVGGRLATTLVSGNVALILLLSLFPKFLLDISLICVYGAMQVAAGAFH